MELPLQISKNTGIPVYVQLEQQILLLLHQGVLHPGDLMPTVRGLAVELGVNSNTVARVYRDLQHQGVLELQRGIGTFVSKKAKARPLGKRDLQGLEKRVRELIGVAQGLGLTPIELFQMIETRWKEQSNV